MIRRLIVLLTAATLHAGDAFAQGAFPTPPPDQAAPATLPSNDAADACTSGFAPLRAEAEARGKLIKAASERHAPPDEACKLIGSFGQAEIKMIRYIEANSACGIPPEIADQLIAGYKNTKAMQNKVCAVARQAQTRGPVGPVGDFDDVNVPARY